MYGNGEWILLGAFVSLVRSFLPHPPFPPSLFAVAYPPPFPPSTPFRALRQILGTCFSLCGSCGRFRRKNEYTY